MSNDDVSAFLGALAIFVCAPVGGLAALIGAWDIGAFTMATGAFLVGLSNHE